MPDHTPTLIHYGTTDTALTAMCGEVAQHEITNQLGEVTCFACRQSQGFKHAQRQRSIVDDFMGVGTPTPVKLSGVMADDAQLTSLAGKAKVKGARNARGMFVIEESIHHGEYRSTRRVEVYSINAVTVDAIIQSSAYCYGSWLKPERAEYTEARNEKLHQLVDDLQHGRTNRDIGWSTFRTITEH